MPSTRPFFDSAYRFIDPIRVFKANDPYYWEVDNIPLKQLEEGQKWLKDQIEGILGGGNSGTFEIDRVNFSELKPYVDGANNIVKVKPGRFTARINDAYKLTSLQIIEKILGYQLYEQEQYTMSNLYDTALLNIINNFKNNTFPYNLNGLIERAFTYSTRDGDVTHGLTLSGEPRYNLNSNSTPVGYPNTVGSVYTSVFGPSQTRVPITTWGQNFGFLGIPFVDQAFIKRWRGVARTAVVDVPSELQIEIPAFDEDDFFYTNEAGQKVLIDANQRIDLVFIYSKPIDTSAVTIAKYNNNVPTTLYAPALGIVKGAGVGVSFKQPFVGGEAPDITDPDGNPIMLASPGDENGSNTGFPGKKGSFPSPDDLMNISPLLLETLAEDHLMLVGQSVLPIAYVFVSKTAGTNSNNINILAASDVIDIRPFFRTTELAYNERAGIAAASPQISISNPVASEGLVDLKIKSLKDSINAIQTDLSNDGKIVGAGAIRGGFYYGVEGVLAHHIRNNFQISNNTFPAQKQRVYEIYGLHNTINGNIPDYPDWDISEWARRIGGSNVGTFPNDYINFHTAGFKHRGDYNIPLASQIGASYSCFKDISFDHVSSRISKFGTDPVINAFNNGGGQDPGAISIYFVKKTIRIDRTQVSWMRDYRVNVQLWNCFPLSSRTTGETYMTAAGAASIWVDKRFDEFTIFVSWVPKDHLTGNDIGHGTENRRGPRYPFADRTDGQHFAGFGVINNFMFRDHSFTGQVTPGESAIGISIYPTVTFEIVGIPEAFQGFANLAPDNPVINLV